MYRLYACELIEIYRFTSPGRSSLSDHKRRQWFKKESQPQMKNLLGAVQAIFHLSFRVVLFMFDAQTRNFHKHWRETIFMLCKSRVIKSNYLYNPICCPLRPTFIVNFNFLIPFLPLTGWYTLDGCVRKTNHRETDIKSVTPGRLGVIKTLPTFCLCYSCPSHTHNSEKTLAELCTIKRNL